MSRRKRPSSASLSNPGGGGGAGGGGGHPEPVERLIDQFAQLPGVGRRSAERMAFHILKAGPEEALRLTQAIADVKQHVRSCAICFNLTDVDPCRICSNPQRDASLVLVV